LFKELCRGFDDLNVVTYSANGNLSIGFNGYRENFHTLYVTFGIKYAGDAVRVRRRNGKSTAANSSSLSIMFRAVEVVFDTLNIFIENRSTGFRSFCRQSMLTANQNRKALNGKWSQEEITEKQSRAAAL
jgi:hypothetical protein